MPLAPHRELTDDQLETCRMVGIPPPPLNCETPFIGVFDFRNPGDTPSLDAPISFRWRFDGRALVFFGAYGLCRRALPPGRKVRRQKTVTREFYGLLPDAERDHHAKVLMEDADV